MPLLNCVRSRYSLVEPPTFSVCRTHFVSSPRHRKFQSTFKTAYLWLLQVVVKQEVYHGVLSTREQSVCWRRFWRCHWGKRISVFISPNIIIAHYFYMYGIELHCCNQGNATISKSVPKSWCSVPEAQEKQRCTWRKLIQCRHFFSDRHHYMLSKRTSRKPLR